MAFEEKIEQEESMPPLEERWQEALVRAHLDTQDTEHHQTPMVRQCVNGSGKPLNARSERPIADLPRLSQE